MARSRKKSKFSRYLPEELIINILSWTKGTSLLRFKSVCKLWHSIISDKNFIESHHTNSLQKPSLLMISYNVEKPKPRNSATIVYSSSPKDSVDLRLPSCFGGMIIENSCNGIVCVRDFSGGKIYLWNPLTMMSKRLPIIKSRKQPLYSRLQSGRLRWGFCHKQVVFGFGCVSHDFKVLKIKYVGDNLSRIDCIWAGVDYGPENTVVPESIIGPMSHVKSKAHYNSLIKF